MTARELPGHASSSLAGSGAGTIHAGTWAEAVAGDPWRTLRAICGAGRLDTGRGKHDASLGRVTCGTCERILDRWFDESDERATERLIKEWTDGEPRVWDLKVHGSRYQRAGIPDHILCVAGVFVAAEVKPRGKRPTALQSREIERIRRAGGAAYVVRSFAEFLAVVYREINGN